MSYLTESQRQKWEPIIDNDELPPIDNNHKRAVTEVLLENQQKFLNESVVTNNTSNVDNVDPIIMSLVRRTMPNLIGYDVCGVQPMTGPTGLIFAMRAQYGSPDVSAPYGRPGDARSGFETGSSVDSNNRTLAQQYGLAGQAPNEALYKEADTTFSGTGSQSANDGTVAYTAYDVGHGFSLAAGEALGQDGGTDFAEMSFTIEKTSVVAQTRALKAEYTQELSHDLRAVHGLDAETELSNLLSVELMAEINREIVNTIRMTSKIAAAATKYVNGQVVLDSNGNPVKTAAGGFDLDYNSDGRWSAEKYKSLLVKINKEANAIAKDTRRGRGNFLIVSSDVASVLDLTGKLVYSPSIDNNLNVDDTGNTFVGVLQGRYKVFIDPYVTYDEVIVGYKGPSPYDAGMFYCPYVPLQLVKVIDNKTFQPKMAFKTRYGKVANPFTTLERNSNSYYRKFKVYNLN